MIRKILLAACAALALTAPAHAQFVSYPGCTPGSVCLLGNGSNAAPSHSFSGFSSSGMYYDTVNGAVAIAQGGGSVARFNGSAMVVTPPIQSSGYVRSQSTTVSGLTSCASAGAAARSFVTDASVTASGNFGATVTGGGANAAPVYCDGTSWRIG